MLECVQLRVFNALKSTAAKLQHGKRRVRPLVIQHNLGLFKEVRTSLHALISLEGLICSK